MNDKTETAGKTTGAIAITGGASGIGLASARALQARGYLPFLLDLKADALAAACKDLGLPAENGLVCDVADETSVTAALESITGCAHLAGVVNSAGIASDKPAVEVAIEEFRRIVDVNLTGTFLVARTAARIWLELGETGAIVNISSVSGICGNKGRSAYGSSKGGVNTMTLVMANELGRHGIRVNAVAPGPTDTPLARRVHTDGVRSQWRRRVPLRRYGTPEEIGAAVAFLASDEASYVNGHILTVDGGFVTAGLAT